jgi:hypothetical protein
MGTSSTAHCMEEINIPSQLHYTIVEEGDFFYWDDTGPKDPSRIIIFTTQSNKKTHNFMIIPKNIT